MLRHPYSYALASAIRRVARCLLSGVKRTSAGLPRQSRQLTNESPYGPALGDCVDGVDGLARHFLPVASTARPWIDARVISAHDESERTPRLRAPSATSTRVSRDGFGICTLLPIRHCRIGDRICERFGETVVAPVVHMQCVGRKECLEWDAVDFVPVPHERKANTSTFSCLAALEISSTMSSI